MVGIEVVRGWIRRDTEAEPRQPAPSKRVAYAPQRFRRRGRAQSRADEAAFHADEGNPARVTEAGANFGPQIGGPVFRGQIERGSVSRRRQPPLPAARRIPEDGRVGKGLERCTDFEESAVSASHRKRLLTTRPGLRPPATGWQPPVRPLSSTPGSEGIELATPWAHRSLLLLSGDGVAALRTKPPHRRHPGAMSGTLGQFCRPPPSPAPSPPRNKKPLRNPGISGNRRGQSERGSGRSRTDDGGFAIRCLSHLATEP